MDYILWNADSKGVPFDPEALYVPALFYIVSMPSQTVDTGVLFFCIKNALNEIFLSGTSVPPATELGARYFLALIPAEDMQDTQMFQDGCDRLFRFFHDNFQVTLQVLTGNTGNYLALPGQTALLKSQAATLLASISEAASKENPKQLVQKIMELIKDNKTISREELAEQVFLSPDYMAKVFKRETGKKLIDYLSEVKLEEAKYRLSKTNESISNIASSLAYSNFSYFSKMFKSETGMSPGEYRKKFKK
ncbi:MAG: helix-turn-helix domain-containing protein [Hominisplanchenecus sp.]